MSTILTETATLGTTMVSPLEPGEIKADGPTPMSVNVKPALGLDIHDVSRDKIIIRPRCKEYAKKQRVNGRTLASFTAMSLDKSSIDASGTPATVPSPTPPTEQKVALLTPDERSAKLAKFFKLGSKSATARVHSGRIEKAPVKSTVANVLIQSRINHPPAPVVVNKIYSGRVEITATASPVKLLPPARTENLPHPRPLPPLLPSAQYQCTCRDPKCCPRCRLLALADRFVTIVAEREQRLRAIL